MNDEKLIHAIKLHDEEAIGLAMEKYSRLLWNISGQILSGICDAADIEECVADVFIDLWQFPEKFDPARGSLKNYLCLKAKSKSLDRFRQLSAHFTEELTEESISSYRDMADDMQIKTDFESLMKAVTGLPEQTKEVVVRRYFYSQKPKDIADAMELDIKQVNNILYRTKKQLREIYDE